MHRARYLIGVLTLVLTIAGAFWLVALLQRLDDRPGALVRVEFRDARGLRPGADVRYRGVRAGLVSEVGVSADGSKVVVRALLEPSAAGLARLNSTFWIVTPRFSGLTDGASGLDTLVRDSYLTFQTPPEAGSPLAAGSLIVGSEQPPPKGASDVLEEVEHGDLLMQVLLPENHGLRVGSAVTFRGMKTGQVRSVELAPDGSHVTAMVQVVRRFRQTVTDKTVFWVARPQMPGSVFTGFRVEEVSALLAPFLGYYAPPGEGLPVENGFRTLAEASRPDFEVAGVPAAMLRREHPDGRVEADGLVVVRVTYAAIENDTFSPNDPVRCEGSGVLFLDRAGRPVVITARSIVDGGYVTTDPFGGEPDISDEQIKVMLPTGTVLHAGRVWVHPLGIDLAAIVLHDPPVGLQGTGVERLHFAEATELTPPFALRWAGADGETLPEVEILDGQLPGLVEHRGGAVIANGMAFGVYGHALGDADTPAVVGFHLLPDDLRPR